MQPPGNMRALGLVGLGALLVLAVAMSGQGSSDVLLTKGGSSLSGKIGSMDVADSLGSSIVDKLSSAMVSKKVKGSGVKKAAENIAEVLEQGKADDASVRSVLRSSKTHHGDDSGAQELRKNLKELHETATKKKAIKMSTAISSALDVSKAGGEKKEATKEALAIAKILEQSKADMSSAKSIEKHAETHGGSKNWDEFWSSKHSLVSRLAAAVGGDGKKQAKKLASEQELSLKGPEKVAGMKASKSQHIDSKESDVPAAIRRMWGLVSRHKESGLETKNTAHKQQLLQTTARKHTSELLGEDWEADALRTQAMSDGVSGAAIKYFQTHQSSLPPP